jgi:hypothetical protein
MAKRKPVNRKMSPPPVPVEVRNGEIVGFPFFDLNEAEGFYKIDSFKSYFADPNNFLKALAISRSP